MAEHETLSRTTGATVLTLVVVACAAGLADALRRRVRLRRRARPTPGRSPSRRTPTPATAVPPSPPAGHGPERGDRTPHRRRTRRVRRPRATPGRRGPGVGEQAEGARRGADGRGQQDWAARRSIARRAASSLVYTSHMCRPSGVTVCSTSHSEISPPSPSRNACSYSEMHSAVRPARDGRPNAWVMRCAHAVDSSAAVSAPGRSAFSARRSKRRAWSGSRPRRTSAAPPAAGTRRRSPAVRTPGPPTAAAAAPSPSAAPPRPRTPRAEARRPVPCCAPTPTASAPNRPPAATCAGTSPGADPRRGAPNAGNCRAPAHSPAGGSSRPAARRSSGRGPGGARDAPPVSRTSQVVRTLPSRTERSRFLPALLHVTLWVHTVAPRPDIMSGNRENVCPDDERTTQGSSP